VQCARRRIHLSAEERRSVATRSTTTVKRRTRTTTAVSAEKFDAVMDDTVSVKTSTASPLRVSMLSKKKNAKRSCAIWTRKDATK
jgi:hypothetical protein